METQHNNGANATQGMSRHTGSTIGRAEHIKQSIVDILSTPIGSRIHRREYGSYVFDLIDRAANPAGRLQLLSAAVDAITRWEPRVLIENISLDVTMDGKVELSYEYRDIDDASKQSASVIISM